MTDTILINNVKKGTKVLFYDGAEGEVLDSKRGIIRLVKRPNIFNGGFDTGSCYVDEITSADVGGEWVPVKPSPAQRKKLDRVRAFLG